jgi:uncharacterized protein involved in type VI secretion and phage assembly
MTMQPQTTIKVPYHLHLPTHALEVIPVAHFKGREALSKIYRFNLLVRIEGRIDVPEMFPSGLPATLEIGERDPSGNGDTDENDIPLRYIHGEICNSKFEGFTRDRDAMLFTLQLAPRIWRL